MALKPDINAIYEDTRFFFDTTAERGGIASLVTAGSGVAKDASVNVAEYSANPSGKKPLGVLMQDVVNVDLTKYKLNFYKDQVQIGGKVTLIKKGEVTTNFVLGTPSAGDVAYLGGSGYTQNSRLNTGFPRVGEYQTSKDSNGYITVFVDLPQVG